MPQLSRFAIPALAGPVLASVLVAFGCGTSHSEADSAGLVTPDTATLIVTSPAFGASSTIPVEYTCEGDNESPPLDWEEAPRGTKSFVVIVDDPDAPDKTFVHWLVYDIPPEVDDLRRGAAESLPSGARHGRNDAKHASWDGPCPPKGRHRYIHKVYALDMELGDDLDEPDKDTLERAMKGHVLAMGKVIGTYEKTE